MVQPASMRTPSEPPQSLTERLAAEMEEEPPEEESVSSMAARFAPETSEERLGRARLDPMAIPAMRMAAQNSFATSSSFTVLLSTFALIPTLLLAALFWFGGIRFPAAPEKSGQVAEQKVVKQQFSLRKEANAATAPTPRPSAPPAVIPPKPAVVTPAKPPAVTPAANTTPSPSTAPAKPAAATPQKPPEIALTAQARIEAAAGGEVPFAISIDAAGALPPRSVIAIRDLPAGASFSQGRPYGASEWNLRPDEIGDLRLRLPKDAARVGPMRVELMTADGKVLDRATTTIALAEPKETLVVRAEEGERIAGLMEHGKKMIDVGYLAGARAYYKRAAEAGSAEAALAVGATYDPAFIDAINAHGTPPDPEAAKSWYERADALGLKDAEAKLKALKVEWTPHHSPAAKPVSPKPAPIITERTETDTAGGTGPFGRVVGAAMSLGTSAEWVEVSESVNMRPSPSSDGQAVKIVPKGKKLRATGREGNWIEVTDPVTSEVGWIFNRYLSQASAPAR